MTDIDNDLASDTGDISASSAEARIIKEEARKKIQDDTSSDDLVPFLPTELIGGSVPYIAGAEEQTVWHAAAQACGTDNVSFCYSVDENKIWYLAVPTHSLASAPNSWCPLAAALPGNSEYWDKETVYLYSQEGVAAGLRWDPETGRMQVFSGMSRIVLPKLQSLDANFVTINTDMAEPVPWVNRQLKLESMSRITAMIMILSGLAVTLITLFYLGTTQTLLSLLTPNLEKLKHESQIAGAELYKNARESLEPDSFQHMRRIQALLDILSSNGATLVLYKVDDGKVTWEALVPRAMTGDTITKMGAKLLSLEGDGRYRIRGTR